MGNGLALTIGLNYVDPQHYAEWDGKCRSAENDSADMAALLKDQGFEVATLLRQDATRDAVIASIRSASQALDSGDIFCLTYAGHGGQVRDITGEELNDQTWCLYDGQLIDDELAQLWTEFKRGVRVLVFSDSCHSGTVTRIAPPPSSVETSPLCSGLLNGRQDAVRCMPGHVIGPVYRANKDFYDGLRKGIPGEQDLKADTEATTLLISACQDDQLAGDGPINGVFTGALLNVWTNWRNREGSYRDFHRAIAAMMPSDQIPNYYVIGAANPVFENQRPFTI